jgi:hypothetical protein
MFPLGRVAEFDEQSRNFAYLPTYQLMPIPPRALHHVWGARLNQGDTGSCTGNAFTGARNTSPNYHPGEVPYDETTARKVYALATTLDSIPGTWNEDGSGEDTGSSGLAAAKASVRLGLYSRYEWCFGLDHLLVAAKDHPVCVGTNWYEDMFTPGDNGLVKVGGARVGGHEWFVRGYDLKHRVAFGVNSWGSDWGINGMFVIGLDDASRLLREDGDAKVPVR